MKMFYKECELCSCKISKLKLYSYKKDLGIYTLKCPNCNASYGLKLKVYFVMIYAILNEILGWTAFLLPFFCVFLCSDFVSKNVAFLIFVWLVSFLGIGLFVVILEHCLNLFIFSKFVLIDDNEKLEVKKTRLIKLKDFFIKLIKR